MVFLNKFLLVLNYPDGKTQFGKTIINNPEEYFTEEVMKQLNESIEKEFKYGNIHWRYDNVISPELCDKLIDRFENSPHQYERQEQGEMSFTQIHFY